MAEKNPEDLSPWSARVTVPVAWGEMDAFGHLNNAVYFRYFENARIAYFERIGMLDFMQTSGIGPILASTECRFRIPLTYPDTVDIDARVSEIAAQHFLMDYRVISRNANAVAATGGGRVVCLDYQTSKKAAVPEELRSAIAALEGRAL